MQTCASLHPKTVFTAATLTVMPLYALMIGLGRTQLTRRIVESPLVFVGLGALYIVCWAQWAHAGLVPLLQHAVQSAQPWPQMVTIAALFQNAHLTALAWIHLLLLDLYQAREVYLDGLRRNVVTAHSLVFCFMFGPSGVLCHAITKKFAGY
ncbi:hypothetical protein WJX72_009556 [[Myrmecia] bisecta]|uniref:Uncharacterized protein n=1 Tax=[Myrmecia] bisecta TaxID=41462 RepID=A0AAW1R8U5_9CHLO